MAPRRTVEPLGESWAFRRTVERARLAASADVPVLLVGESGTGKEVLARAIHEASSRCGAPFVAVNAAAVPAHLLEAELFGHERGAYTGADRARLGLFREAQGGTLLVDEIGDLPLALQAKLLRVLQEGEVRPVGASREVRVDARVVTATHRDLPSLVAEGAFRLDLYYRVSVFVVHVPPLRERVGDVLVLAQHLLARHARGAPPALSPEAARLLLEHPWPGNVRELENACRHALVLCPSGEAISPEHLPPTVRAPEAPAPAPLSLRAARDEVERDRILVALESARGNRTQAARRLGISRQTLHERLRRLGVGPGVGRPGRLAAPPSWDVE